MDRAIPSINKILRKKQQDRDDEKLVSKLREIKKSHSSYNFRVTDKVKIYKRHAYNDITRNLEIRRENQILAKKIKCIGDEYKHKKSETNLLRTATNTARQTLRNTAKNFHTPSAEVSKLGLKNGFRSLNDGKRKREMLRITMDNLHLRDRIMGKTATYTQEDWMKHAKSHYDNLKMHCEFPVLIEQQIIVDSNAPDENYNTFYNTKGSN
jgi:hypothetical protein